MAIKVSNLKIYGDWNDVKRRALFTQGLKLIHKPDSTWKKKMLHCMHSPIRFMFAEWTWTIPTWVSTHFVRHWLGVEHFVISQREDKTGIKREDLKQSHPVNHMVVASFPALVSISRRRLCESASWETVEAYEKMRFLLSTKEPELAGLMMPDCKYRGGICHNLFDPCGYYPTAEL